jgi:predicted adenine nucleotide alpha hydrolase (AANH) superfamily ATPase
MRIVLHICCGICAGGVAERLKSEGHEVLGFFYNPNIHPREEYERRLEVARVVARELGFQLEVPPYDPDEWHGVAGHLAREPEDGARCVICYRLRLEKTEKLLVEKGWDAITTTLTVSPRKRAAVVNQVGVEVAGDKFLARDFKKQDGFKRANELARAWGVYRQNYCGCLYSVRTAMPAAKGVN